MTASNTKQPRITDIRLVKFGCEQAIQVDFSNDRHYQVVIAPPHGSEQVGDALLILVGVIRRDQHMREAS